MSRFLGALPFKGSQTSFLGVLDGHGIRYSRRSLPIGTPMARGVAIEIVVTGGWGSVAVVALAWASVASARKTRKINVTAKDGQAIWLEGCFWSCWQSPVRWSLGGSHDEHAERQWPASLICGLWVCDKI